MALRPLLRRLPRYGHFWQPKTRSLALRQLSQGAESGSNAGFVRRGWLVLAGIGTCAVAAWGLRRRGREVHVLPRLKAGGEEEAKKEGEEKPKISGRELRYKAFASYIYKGEPYMSARDFLESLIRDEPRCKASSGHELECSWNGVRYLSYVSCPPTPSCLSLSLFLAAEDKEVIDDKVGMQ